MAGVSLALRRMLGSRSVVDQAAGYAYAGAAMAGPWLLSAVAMLALDAGVLPAAERFEFQARVLWSYAISTLLTGVVLLPVARAVSDRLYVGDLSAVAPLYAAGVSATLVLHGAASLLFLAAFPVPAATAAAQAAFLGALGWIWLGMAFLTAVRRVVLVTAVFAAGLAASVVTALLLARVAGTAGLLWGMAAGHVFIAAFLGARLRAEFPSERAFDAGFLRTAREHPWLPALGVAQAAALWVDKAVFWASPWGIGTPSGLRVCPVYDNAVYLAYLSIVPALALLFIRVEITLAGRCRSFFDTIRRGGGLEELRARRTALLRAFRGSLWRIVRLQGPLTILVILLGPRTLEAVGLDGIQYYVFRMACLGAFLQVLVMGVLLAALHLARYRLAAGLALLQFVSCGTLTAMGVAAGVEYSGLGLVGSGILSLAVGYPLLLRTLRELDRLTFMSPPS